MYTTTQRCATLWLLLFSLLPSDMSLAIECATREARVITQPKPGFRGGAAPVAQAPPFLAQGPTHALAQSRTAQGSRTTRIFWWPGACTQRQCPPGLSRCPRAAVLPTSPAQKVPLQRPVLVVSTTPQAAPKPRPSPSWASTVWRFLS